ncbi:hypothetical protein Trydic_g4022 [Trypoxylus dichotomus]
MNKYSTVTEVTIRNQVKYSFYMVTSCFAFKIFSTVQYESILFVPKLGCQINVKYAMGYSTKFIPQHIIGGILVNEVFSMQRVLFVLTILIKEHNKNTRLIPLFTGTKPRLNCIETIYRELQT